VSDRVTKPIAAGKWAALIAGPGNGSRNQTGIGVAFYDDEGNLAGTRFEGVGRAIERGDLPDTPFARGIVLHAPETVAGMEKKLGTFANAMSLVRWEDLLPTLDWSDEMVDDTFRMVCGDAEDQPGRSEDAS
jgi:hypothetical protein